MNVNKCYLGDGVKKQYPHALALSVADEIVARLKPARERIAIAGSLRRLKDTVGDIEILYVPRMTTRQDGLFDEKIVSVAEEVIDGLLDKSYFQKRPSKTGVYTWGMANKFGFHVDSDIPVDLFSTDSARWWVSLVIRTGSKETNLRLTMGANKLNRTLNAYGIGVTDRLTGEVTPARSEQDVFALCGVPWLEPRHR